MDTILRPRNLSETESDESTNVNSDFDLKKLSHDTTKESLKSNEDEKIIIHPTARFLQVNPKKISSFDLLVHPPKRPCLFTDIFPKGNEIPEEKPILECIHFENETKIQDSSKESCGGVSKIHESLGKKKTSDLNDETEKSRESKTTPFGQSKDKLELLFRFSQQSPCSHISQAQNFPANDGSPRSPKEDNASYGSLKQFPCSENYLSYVTNGQLQSFQTVYGVVNEKDENKNYICEEKSFSNASSKDNQSQSHSISKQTNQSQNQKQFASKLNNHSTHSSVLSIRTLKKPVYRLPQTNDMKPEQKASVYLKESDYNSAIDFDGVGNQQLAKRRKKEYSQVSCEDESERSMEEKNGRNISVLYTICNELTNEEEILSSVGESPLLSEHQFSAHTNVTHDSITAQRSSTPGISHTEVDSQTPSLTPPFHRDPNTTNEFSDRNAEFIENVTPFSSPFLNVTFHNSYIHDIPSANMGFLDKDLFSSDANTMSGNVSNEKDQMSHDSPFAFFLQDSPAFYECNASSGFMFDTGSFMERLSSPDSVSRIEDVTDEYSELQNDCKSVNTILHSKDPTFLRHDSTSCQLVEGLFDTHDEGGVDGNSSKQNDNMFEEDEQEFLIQPTTHLQYSTSLHSALETGNEAYKSSTTDKLIEKKTKSDYFVGKIAGLSKSLMKIYRTFTRTPSKETDVPFDNSKGKPEIVLVKEKISQNKDKVETIKSVKYEENFPPQNNQSQHSIKNTLETCYRKMSSGNRISIVNIPNSIQLNRSTKASILSESNIPGESKKVSLHTITDTLSSKEKRQSQKRSLKQEKTVKTEMSYLTGPDVRFARSSSSSSDTLKTQFLKKVSEKKSIKEDMDSNANIVKRFTRLFSRTRSKKSKHTRNVTVPSNTIAQHTDSIELYRERRTKFFQEQKEFQDDSLRVYFKMLMTANATGKNQDSTLGSKENSWILNASGGDKGKGSGSPNLPLSSAIPIMKYLRTTESFDSDVVIPARVALSESAIPTTRNRPLGQNLLLQCPPLVHMLALTAQAQGKSIAEGASDEIQTKFKRPFKGILKKRNANK